jgi:hypothetical protein
MTRILVEIKQQFRYKEKQLLSKIQDILGLYGVTKVRLIGEYDIEGNIVQSDCNKIIAYHTNPLDMCELPPGETSQRIILSRRT